MDDRKDKNCREWVGGGDLGLVRLSKAQYLCELLFSQTTVNSDIFLRVLFSHMRSFLKIKSSRNGDIHR